MGITNPRAPSPTSSAEKWGCYTISNTIASREENFAAAGRDRLVSGGENRFPSYRAGIVAQKEPLLTEVRRFRFCQKGKN